MAENSDSRDSDNSWVIAGSGGFPVETVGPELGAATQTPADEEPAGHTLPKGHHTEASASPGKKSEGSQLNTSPSPEEAEFKVDPQRGDQVTPEPALCSAKYIDSELNQYNRPTSQTACFSAAGWTCTDPAPAAPFPLSCDSEEYPRETPSPAASPRPGALGDEAPEIQAQEGPGSKGPKLGSDTNTPGSAPTGRAGEPQEEGSSGEDDAEGLRRQQPQDSRQAPWGPAERRGAEAASDGESGLSVNSCLLGVLALLGIGLLAFSGAIYDPGDGPMDPGDIPDGEQQPLAAGVKDWLQQPPLDTAGDPQSLHSMSLLLDKLAKENQDIRLMQAELQAQKDELQALLQKSEGEKASVGSQQQSLAGENARLHQALQQAAEAHRSAQAELRELREQLQGLEREGAAETPRPSEGLAAERPHEEQLLPQELARQRGLLGSVRRELEEALQRAQGSGGTEQLLVQLAGVEQRLAQELQRAESWEQTDSGGRGGEGRGATEPSRPPWLEPPKADKKEGGWHKRQETREERRRRHGDPGGRERREQDGAKPPKRQEQPEPHRRQGLRDTKPAKDQNGQRRAGGGKGALQGPHEHNVFWEPPRLQRYRAPQGCTGVADCARQEGLELFGAELAPVQKGQFLQLLQGYMAGLGWGQHYAGLAARLDGAFASDGTFAHDHLRFRHFVEDVEELLEELAEQEQGDEEAADDFEEYVLRHYGGDGFARKERARRRAKQQSKERHGHGPRGKENSPPDKG
ncbi:pre-B-cell leukemia transcription factor-interacting protein 1 isoform X2 [Chelonia mydas]|uniref:pre-B-cell leukemia transcription factor-interacting protein 1 isoform X2 n=1 Tax=Chelonia mydas TaxID=8469 RepID=UPI0018A1D48C|nr:pre-B-cell leukemia transcription factor-interacting protein 1 isoform X2 [Chelonia mydas]